MLRLSSREGIRGTVIAQQMRDMNVRGFTLAEIVVVLMLSGIAVAVATPTVSRSYARTAARSAADEFATTLAMARSTAVRYGRVAELHIDAPYRRFWVEIDTSSTGGMMDTVGVVRESRKKLTVTSDRSIICFDGRGLPTTRGACEAADATIIFTQGATSDTVKITALGMIDL